MTNDPWDRRAEKFDEKPVFELVKWALAGVLAAVVIAIVISLISTGSVFFEAGRAKLVAPAEVTKRVYQPDNIIGQVAFFTQTCEDVGRDYSNWHNNEAAYERQLQLTNTAGNPAEQAQAQARAEQLSTYAQGAVGQLNQDAAAYNARSINYTANPFKSAGLPYRIQPPTDPASLRSWQPPSCG